METDRQEDYPDDVIQARGHRMKESYRVLYNGGTGELIEKKSRFIANLQPVRTEQEAVSFIEEMKKKYWDASHNCYAWILGCDGLNLRCSDDGEPAQTAGRPMLDVLAGEGICDVCAVVTRYFGGTLLGTGGLVRAYSCALREGIKASQVVLKQLGRMLEITTDYNGIGKIRYHLAQKNITVLGVDYTDKVVVTSLVPIGLTETIKAELTEVTSGRAIILEKDTVYYGLLEKEVVLL